MPALRVVVQVIDHSAVAVLQHGPTVGVLHRWVSRKTGTAQSRLHEEDIVHLHLVLMTPERPGVCALLQMLHWKVSARLPFVFRLLDPS